MEDSKLRSPSPQEQPEPVKIDSYTIPERKTDSFVREPGRASTDTTLKGSRSSNGFGRGDRHSESSAVRSTSSALLRSRTVGTAHGGLDKSITLDDIMQVNGEDVPRRDCHSWLSAPVEDPHSDGHGGEHERGMPILLIAFVCIIASISGFVVVGVHKAILYAGCPLGINGCNEFLNMEKKGYKLLKFIDSISDGLIPEEVTYIVVACFGSIIVAQIIVRVPPWIAWQVCGGGTIQALVSVATGERIRMHAAITRVVVTTIFLGAGGTLGMEGPAIQACTALATMIGWRLGMRGKHTQSLLASLGFACGFAGAFNSPLAGIMFAMEELQHVSPVLSRSIICMILVASCIATAVVRACQGNTKLFEATLSQDIIESVSGGSIDKVFGDSMWMLIAVPIGLLCAVTSAFIVKAMRLCRVLYIIHAHRLPYTVWMVLQALVVAVLGGIVFRTTGLRGVWGIGYSSLQDSLDKDFNVAQYAIFMMGKALATVVSIAMRCPGDMLEPILLVGGALGGMVGRILSLVPEIGDQVMRPCIIFGNVGLFAACFRFPLTPIIIILEVTGMETYTLILPAVLASFTGCTFASRMEITLFEEVMFQDGLDLHGLSRLSSGQDRETPSTEAPEADSQEPNANEDADCENRSNDSSFSSNAASSTVSSNKEVFHFGQKSINVPCEVPVHVTGPAAHDNHRQVHGFDVPKVHVSPTPSTSPSLASRFSARKSVAAICMRLEGSLLAQLDPGQPGVASSAGTDSNSVVPNSTLWAPRRNSNGPSTRASMFSIPDLSQHELRLPGDFAQAPGSPNRLSPAPVVPMEPSQDSRRASRDSSASSEHKRVLPPNAKPRLSARDKAKEKTRSPGEPELLG
eukprot:TRINITY_DN10722_c0_g1_i1.p1 TRINITY_DN10722_c0_g1~~TRINITY_DN10722_c0_g1_i1.p1  ORF type:complete len:860 (+),score=123.69 TRINITY_DN10722_c0_g1_i1:90-2669(+)